MKMNTILDRRVQGFRLDMCIVCTVLIFQYCRGSQKRMDISGIFGDVYKSQIEMSKL